MVLRVALEDFPAEAERHCGKVGVYVVANGTGSIASAAHPSEDRRVESFSSRGADEVRALLRAAGCAVGSGRWLGDSEANSTEAEHEFHLVAIAYVAAGSSPGLWVEVFPDAVADEHAIRTMHQEFVDTGEIPDISFNQFLDVAKPTVVSLSHEQILEFRARRHAAQ
ncbi:MAG: hypothetical protein ACOYON_06615 [Fimbriimonas sp.]